MENEKALAVVQAGEVLDFGAMLPAIERRVQVIQRVHQLIDSQADPRIHFDRFDEIIRRNFNYAKLAFRTVGGKYEWLKDPDGKPMVARHDYEDDQGKYYVYEAYGRYTLPNGESVEQSGMFSSRDKFFGKAGGEFKDTADVDERSVRQAAQTECFKKCIFTALGMGDVTEEEMQHIGHDTTQAKGHTFAAGTQSAKSGDTKENKDQRAEIERMCRELFDAGYKKEGAVFDPTTPEQVLKQVTEQDYEKDGEKKHFSGWSAFAKITPAGLGPTYKNVKDAHADYFSQRGEA